MNTKLIEKLKNNVDIWRKADYKGVFSETKSILLHIKKIKFLYKPQIEALETYIYLKEVIGNKLTNEIVTKLYDSKEQLESLQISQTEKLELAMSDNWKEKVLEMVKLEYSQFDYPNQVYALTMGSGKTILMATMILYEFILSVNHPTDERFAKNILIFAPDTTIIESLKEIKSFDYSKVVPKEYQNTMLNIKYHYLESTETSVNFLGNYNIVISNSQKIIIKTKHKIEKNMTFLTNETEREKESIINKRLQAIQRLQNLSIFVDEAHHSYGNNLEGTLKKTRETISFLHEEGHTPLVNVVNLTGTPYINNKLINDVVFHFGLKQGIEQGILKKVRFFEYGNVKSEGFVNQVIDKFINTYGERRLEGKLPKIAFYASDIDDLQQNLRPAIEKALANKNISIDKILEYHTKKEDGKEEFIKLDTISSNKQIILLVGKGTEGWNVRSLVATALFRKPSSSIFVLQSSTRCLRSIGDNSTYASIFLSEVNAKVLDKELENNFGTTRSEIENQLNEKIELKLEVLKKKKITVKRTLHEIQGVIKNDVEKIKLPSISQLKAEIKMAYKTESIITVDNTTNIAKLSNKATEELDVGYEKLPLFHIICRLSQKTHIPCILIKQILENSHYLNNEFEEIFSKQIDVQEILTAKILEASYVYKEKVETIEEEIELTKNFPFKISRDKGKQGLVVYREDNPSKKIGFHINPYAFDSTDEKELFNYLQNELEENETISDLYFTGNISDTTHTDFYFEYMNPREKKIARYFPDFLIETNKGRFIVIEVKGDNERTDYQANKKQYESGNKELTNEVFAKEIGFKEFQQVNKNFDYQIIFNAGLQQKQQELLGRIL